MSLSVIRYPSGKYVFVGRVPAVLAFDCQDSDLVAAATRCGLGIARKIAARSGRSIGTRVWDSAESAIDAATAAGFTIDLI